VVKPSQITLEPIGEVRNSIEGPMRQGWEGVVSKLILKPELAEAMEGLEQFSHIIVVFWMNKLRLERGIPAKVHPRGRADFPLVGLFATRAPYRPNPVGVSVVKLLELQGNVLKVVGLDAIDKTPVIDIKPYLPGYNSVSEVRIPDWAAK
jgi:tRNA-Thr(GGU) m(6)t(6)A37 methyltransferase TsaA